MAGYRKYTSPICAHAEVHYGQICSMCLLQIGGNTSSRGFRRRCSVFSATTGKIPYFADWAKRELAKAAR